MSRIEFATMTSLPVAVAGSCALLLHLTALPLWGAVLISLPVGIFVSILMGFGLGIAIDLVFQKLERRR